MKKFISKSEKETFNIAKDLAKMLKPNDVVCLVGDLGTGKTHFVKGVASHFKINDVIDSPTFTIVKEYDVENNTFKKLYHFDVYRIERIEELDDIGFDEYIYSNNISIIEWADLIKQKIPKNAIWITINKIDEDNTREIIIQ